MILLLGVFFVCIVVKIKLLVKGEIFCVNLFLVCVYLVVYVFVIWVVVVFGFGFLVWVKSFIKKGVSFVVIFVFKLVFIVLSFIRL